MSEEGAKRSSPRKFEQKHQDDEDMNEYDNQSDQDHSEGDEQEISAAGLSGQQDAEPKRRKAGRPPKPGSKRKSQKIMPKLYSNEDDGTDTMEEIASDETGETKITADGYLRGGREFAFPTFTLPRHPTKLYLFTVDIAKLLDFRDTYIFYLKNPGVKRITGNEADRDFLNEKGILPSQIKNRPISLVLARNAFRVLGHLVIRKGRPIHDDYFVGEHREPIQMEDSMDIDQRDIGYEGNYAQDDGPYKRSGPAILGFENPEEDLEAFEPGYIPSELADDQWMLKCAISAADFNRRLIRNRPTSFLDLHTNVEQVSSASQPLRVLTQMHDSSSNVVTVDGPSILKSENSIGWRTVADSNHPSMFPIALLRNQHQDVTSVYVERFKETDSPYYLAQGQVSVHQASYGLPRGMHGVLPFKSPQVVKTPAPKERVLRSEAAKECLHCSEMTAPSQKDGIPSDFMLRCSKCMSNHHPVCVDFDEPEIISKIMLYDWTCTNCKTCVNCSKAGSDEKMLFCDLCDKAFHMFCLDPPLTTLPSGAWLCKDCGECRSCSNKPHKMDDPADFWHHVVIPDKPNTLGSYLCTYCDPCHFSFNAGRFCPLCLHVYDKESEDEAMVCCDKCDRYLCLTRWVHVDCDPQLTPELYEELMDEENPEFTCVLCQPKKLEAMMNDRQADGFKLKPVQYLGHVIIAPPLVDP